MHFSQTPHNSLNDERNQTAPCRIAKKSLKNAETPRSQGSLTNKSTSN